MTPGHHEQRRREAAEMLEHPDFLASLPKTDLHNHLDGSLRLSTLQELADEQGVTLPADSEAELRQTLGCGSACESLEEYLESFRITLSVLQEPYALRRVAREIVEDAAGHNVRYLELRFSPILHLDHGYEEREILDAVLAGMEEGSSSTAAEGGAIICGMRNIDPEKSRELAQLAVDYKDRGVVGFDLAGAERDYPAKDHIAAFYKILNNNVNCTCHAGEGYGPASIHQALHYCGAHRIGHGTRLHEDPELMTYVNDHRIPLEICLTSNVMTGTVARVEDHPFKLYYEKGLRVTLNTDNTLLGDTDMTQELRAAVEAFHLGVVDVRRLLLNGFKSTFLHFGKKVALLTRVLDEMDGIIARSFGARYVPPRDHF